MIYNILCLFVFFLFFSCTFGRKYMILLGIFRRFMCVCPSKYGVLRVDLSVWSLSVDFFFPKQFVEIYLHAYFISLGMSPGRAWRWDIGGLSLAILIPCRLITKGFFSQNKPRKSFSTQQDKNERWKRISCEHSQQLSCVVPYI